MALNRHSDEYGHIKLLSQILPHMDGCSLAARLVGHMVSGRCDLHGSLGAAPEVVLFENDGHGPVLCPDSSYDGPDPLRQ